MTPYDRHVDPPNESVAGVSGDKPFAGPAIVLKIMAGDEFNDKVDSWYSLGSRSPGTPIDPTVSVLDFLKTEHQILDPGTQALGGGGGELTTNGVLCLGVLSFLTSHDSYDDHKPKAFLNWVLFDEQFNCVAKSSGFDHVGNDTTLTHHVFNNMPR